MFGKFFASTFTGSMVGSGLNVFAVWGYVIANTRQDGTVEINPPIVAAVLGCAVGEVTSALDVLTSPDPNSRSKKEEGRRLIQQAAFLYSVPTYADYRAIRDDDGRKEYMRQYMQGYRDKKKAVNVNVNSGKTRLAQAEAEADTDAEEALSASNEALVPGKPGTRDCPHSEIVAAYHEILPELATVRDWTPDRQAFLRARWREKAERQTVAWWRGYFEYVRTCPFLMGQGSTAGDRDPFYADMEWLVRPKNFRKVIEGKYQRRAA